jgi:SAM-dependent methyltransferase
MLQDPECPICTASNWEIVGSRTYSISDIPQLDDYQTRRYRVLFEIWFPGKTEITLALKLCSACGFILYTPRPSEQDLQKKYRFLLDSEIDSADESTIKVRAGELFHHLKNYLKQKDFSILDFGGGDGSLMSEFLSYGFDCFVIDYHPKQIDGVKRLGDTLEYLPADRTFDIIICSHVLEHIVDPYNTLGSLRQHLSSEGVLYVEVPMEIWRRAPLRDEPVTHINFFTRDSLNYLLSRAGFQVVRCRLGKYTHSPGYHPTALRAFAKRGSNQILPSLQNASRNSWRLISPDFRMLIRMSILHPDWVWRYILNRLPGR